MGAELELIEFTAAAKASTATESRREMFGLWEHKFTFSQMPFFAFFRQVPALHGDSPTNSLNVP